MSTIHVYPVVAIHDELLNFVSDPTFQAVLSTSNLPPPVIRPWAENPREFEDFLRLMNEAPMGSFIGKPPIRIVFGDRWIDQNPEQKMIIILHELAHAEEYAGGMFNLNRGSIINVPDSALRKNAFENRRLQAVTNELINAQREVWVECRIFSVTPDSMMKRIRLEIQEMEQWRLRVQQQRREHVIMDEQYILLRSTQIIVWLKGIARGVRTSNSTIAEVCVHEARTMNKFRSIFCTSLIQTHKLRSVLQTMEEATEETSYCDEFARLLKATLRAEISAN